MRCTGLWLGSPPLVILRLGSARCISAARGGHETGPEGIRSFVARLLPSGGIGTELVAGPAGVPAEDPRLQQMLAAIPGSDRWRQRLLLPGRTGNLGDWYARADLFVLSSRYEGSRMCCWRRWRLEPPAWLWTAPPVRVN